MSSSDLLVPGMPAHAPMAASAAAAPPRYLFSPVVDFLCLGGSSIFLLPLVLLLPIEENKVVLGTGMMLLAFVINHPHFAHSYQIFYRDFGRKAFGADGDAQLRARYVFAGLIVPALLAMFFVAAMWQKDVRMLGYAGNAMALLVGWHYVKQGYGMLMVDAALKRKYFPASDKTILLANGYTVWFTAWLLGNKNVRELDLWGLKYYSFDMPDALLYVAAAAATVSGAMTLFVFARRWKANGGVLPVNGVVAYLVTLYGWTLFVKVSPLWLLVVPALHSLQYMIVVYRFQSNYEASRSRAADAPAKPAARRIFRHIFVWGPRMKLAWFAVAGFIIGFIGFYGAPVVVQALVDFDRAIFGPTVFLFVFWIFINVHHYFLDSVMWRRENPEARQFLFS